MFGKLKSLANSGISSALNALQNNEEFVSSIIDKVVSINFLETLN